MAGYLHRTAQPSILAAFLPWGVSTGAGRARPAGAKVVKKKGTKKRGLQTTFATKFASY